MLTWGVPLRRAVALGGAALLLALVRVPGRPHTLCPFRAVTGIPCPFCGSTTAAVRVGEGHLGAALQASPLAVLGALALIAAGTSPGQQAVRFWRALPLASRVVLGTAVLTAGECWQLARFGLF